MEAALVEARVGAGSEVVAREVVARVVAMAV